MRPGPARSTFGCTSRREATMNILWTIVVYAFVLGTLGAVAIGMIKLFGGGPRPQ